MSPLTAREILARLPHSCQATKSEVNSVLYRELTGVVTRDDTYRWVLVTGSAPRTSGAMRPLFSNDDLASIAAAVSEEIAAANAGQSTDWLNIDAIARHGTEPESLVQFIDATKV